jgi:hypothetical protein
MHGSSLVFSRNACCLGIYDTDQGNLRQARSKKPIEGRFAAKDAIVLHYDQPQRAQNVRPIMIGTKEINKLSNVRFFQISRLFHFFSRLDHI